MAVSLSSGIALKLPQLAARQAMPFTYPFGRPVAPLLVGHQPLFSLGLHRIDHPTVLRRIVLIHLVERGGTPTAMFMYDTLLDHFLVTRIVTRRFLQQSPEEGVGMFFRLSLGCCHTVLFLNVI